MRSSGLIIVVAAVVGLTACRCNKAPGPQTVPSTQSVTSAAAPNASDVTGVAGAPSTETTQAGAAAPSTEPIVFVKPLDFAPVKGSKFLPMKVKEDGMIWRQDKAVAKIVGDKLTDDDGSPVATFVAPAKIAIEGSKVSFDFNEKDELEGPGGLKIAVGDDGVPTVIAKAKAPPEKLTGKFVDFDPKTRRAAEIVLAIKEIKKAAKDAKPKKPKAAGGEPKKDKKKDKKKGKKKKG